MEKLHKKERHNLYTSQSRPVVSAITCRMMRNSGHIARRREMKSTYTIVVETSQGKGTFGRPRRRREVNIKINCNKTWRRSGQPPMAGSCGHGRP
jgi:hypothetical protein